jgi:hypothetical protein
MVRFNSWINPFREIPTMLVQEVTAAAMLAMMRRGIEKEAEDLQALADARDKEIRRRNAVWN